MNAATLIVIVLLAAMIVLAVISRHLPSHVSAP